MSVEPARPNPDELLARVQAEERQQARGKLRTRPTHIVTEPGVGYRLQTSA